MWWMLGIVGYAATVFVNAGFLYADHTRPFARSDSAYENRLDMAFSIGISLLPVAWFLTPFMTAFFFYGWKWPGSPLTDEEKKRYVKK